MNWYRTLDIHQKINLKELTPTICGAHFSGLCNLLGMKETINVIHNKLRLEGFAV